MSSCDLHLHTRYSDRPSEWVLRKLGIPDSLSQPRKLYESLRRAGREFITFTDHNTLGAVQDLEGAEGYFPSVETTTYFPEDGCKVHLLIWNLTSRQFEEIENVRANIYNLARFLHQEKIPHAVSHPLTNLDGKFTPDHFEKLILLFRVFEKINGLRTPVAQEIAFACLASLTQAKVAELSASQGIDPMIATPWVKSFMGGSNDHSGLYAGRVWTEVKGARDLESFFRGVMDGKGVVHGNGGDPAQLVNGLFHVMFDFIREKVGHRAPRGSALLLGIVNRFLAGENPVELGFLDKARYLVDMVTSGKILEFWKSPEGGLSKELSAYLTNPATRKELQKVLSEEKEPERRSFRLASKVINDVGFRIVTRFLEKAGRGDFLGGLEPLAGVVPLGLATAPYFYSFYAHRTDRDLLSKVAARFLPEKPDTLRNNRKGWCTDTLEDVNGVARTIRTMAAAGRRSGADITILTSRPEKIVEEGVINFTSVGEFAIPEYELQKLSFPPILEFIDHVARKGYTELILSTPGPMGITGLIAARILGLKTSAIYHTDFPQYARFLSEDDPMVEGIAWNYMQWFYSQVDRVYVNSQNYLERWKDRGLSQEKLHILPRGLEISAFDVKHRRADFWPSRGGVGKIILYVGRISKEKDLEFLARVASKVSQNGNCTFAFVGEGPLEKDLKRKIPKAVFTGVLHGADLGHAYASADLFVFPSTTDTYGNVVVEALASGLPVLVSNQGGPKELLRSPDDGEVLPAGNVEDWVRAIARQLLSENGQNRREERRKRTITGRGWDDAFKLFWTRGLV